MEIVFTENIQNFYKSIIEQLRVEVKTEIKVPYEFKD